MTSMSLLNTPNQSTQTKQGPLSIVLYLLLMIAMVFVPFAVFPTMQSSVTTPKVFAVYGIVLLGVFVWLLNAVLTKTFRLRRTSLDIPLLLTAGVFLISSFFSVIPSVSFLGKMNVFVLHTAIIASLILWSWLLVQALSTLKRWHGFLQLVLLAGSMHGILFLVHTYMPLTWIERLGTASVFSPSNTHLSMYFGLMVVLSLGQVLPKHVGWGTKLFGILVTIISVFALLRLGFDAGLIVTGVGGAMLIIIGTTYLSEVHSGTVVASFSLFVASVLLSIFGIPGFLKATLPVEVSMGGASSWTVTKASMLDSAKDFIIGAGPGTYLQSFSEFRDVAFNVNQVAWTVRFNTPYNSFFAFLTETGVLGTIAFLIVLVGGVGIALSAWNKTRPTSDADPVSTAAETARVQVFVVVGAWLALTVGLFTSFFGIALWFMWWTLLAMMLAGIASFLPQVITERRISLQVSPQYSLVLSFVLVIVATGIIILGAFGTRIFMADVAYAKALQSSTIEETQGHLNDTLRLRPNYIPYNLSRARLALQRARVEAQQPEPNTDRIANFLAVAVNTAREATNMQGSDVETWETLASMYLNTQSLVPEANEWAQESLEQAIALESTNPVFQWQMGNAKTFAGDLEGAEENYKQAIRLKPDYIVAYVSLAALLESQERYDQAIALYQPIFRVIEDNPEALFTLGRLFYTRQAEGDLERAETVLIRAIELSPNYANARFTLGLVYEAAGNNASALEQYEVVAERNPDNAEVLEKLRVLGAPPSPPVPVEEPTEE